MSFTKIVFFPVILFSLFISILWVPVVSHAEDYRIAPADVLEISIWGEADLTRQLVVRPDGKVSFPLIGDLEVGGKTTSELKKEVEKKIRAFIPEASATVIVYQLGSLQYFVIGKVAKPGMYNVSRPLTVLQALSLAGGVTTFADESNISIIRSYGKKTIRIPFDYDEVKDGEHLEQNILLKRGDVVLVP